MKRAIYWLMGDKAGAAIVGTWNWLWGIPVESGGKVAVAVAEESLRSMQESVLKLTQAVSTQMAAYQRAQQKYQAKVRDVEQFQRQAVVAQQHGDQSAARLAMSKVIQIEQLLPQLETRVQQAEQFVNASREKLERERMKLEAYKMDMENIKDMAEMNEALATLAKVNSDLGIDSARSQFEEAKNAIERRSLTEQAFAELSENPTEKLASDLNQMELDDEVTRRLRQLSEPKEP